MGSSIKRFAFVGLFACCSLVVACNRTEGECYPRGEGGASPGAGGGPVVPTGAGGFGDVPPEPQGAGEPPDPCNVAEGKVYTCNGDVVCTHPSGSTDGCHYVDRKEGGQSAGQVIERLVVACQEDKPGFSCQQNTLSCTDGPPVQPAAIRYLCNGGVSCTDSKGFSDGCSYSSEEVYADDAQDAADLLVEVCEDNLHDKTGNNCDHGGFCCSQGSLTCNKG